MTEENAISVIPITGSEKNAEEAEQTVAQKIEEIGKDLLATSMLNLERVQNGEVISKEEEDKYKQMNKWYRELKKVFTERKNIKKIMSGKEEPEKETPEEEEKFSADILEKIKKKKSMMGDIRQDAKIR